MALGATRGGLYRLVFSQYAWQVGLCLSVSLVFSSLGAAMLQSVLFNISPRDVLTYIAVAGLLILVSLLAMLIPACRATKADPMIAINYTESFADLPAKRITFRTIVTNSPNFALACGLSAC